MMGIKEYLNNINNSVNILVNIHNLEIKLDEGGVRLSRYLFTQIKVLRKRAKNENDAQKYRDDTLISFKACISSILEIAEYYQVYEDKIKMFNASEVLNYLCRSTDDIERIMQIPDERDDAQKLRYKKINDGVPDVKVNEKVAVK